ncbi:hypothetical protein LLH23_02375 [bacterium]|nr:hypothetical protein [bacterium]
MEDVNLRMVLSQAAYVDRAETAIGTGLDPLSPRYARDAAALPALVQPLRGDLVVTVAGKLPEATHVVYLEGGVQLRPGDVLAVAEGASERKYEVLDVEDEGGQGHHLRVVVRSRG